MKARYSVLICMLALALGYIAGNYQITQATTRGNPKDALPQKLGVEPVRQTKFIVRSSSAGEKLLEMGRNDVLSAWSALEGLRASMSDRAWKELRTQLYDQTFPQYTFRRREQLAIWNDPNGRSQMALMEAWTADPTGKRALAVADKLEGKVGIYELLAHSSVAGTWSETAEFNAGISGLSPAERGRVLGVVIHNWVADDGAFAGAAWLSGHATDASLDEARLNVFISDPTQVATLNQISDPSKRNLAIAVAQALSSKSNP